MKLIRACLWREAFFVWCSPRGLVEAPHDSGVGWKQFMMMLEEFWFVAVLHSTSRARPVST